MQELSFTIKTMLKKSAVRVVYLLGCGCSLAMLVSGCSVNFSSNLSPNAVSTNPAQQIQRVEQLKSPEILKLPTGKQFQVFSIETVTFPNGDPPALQLRYITDLSIKDKTALEKEATQIWDLFRPRVEKAEKITGIVTARERIPIDKVKDIYLNYTFGWRKDAQGKWQIIPQKKQK